MKALTNILASTLIGLSAFAMSVTAVAGDSQCTPFGDRPAEVNHGYYANFVSSHHPVCFGGKILGPWNDADGTARYSCLYEPASAGKDDPLPLVIFLHGSIATADSIRLTGLYKLIGKTDLGGKKPGFIMLAPEGRYTTHFYTGIDSNGRGWGSWYRQVDPSGEEAVGGT